MEAVNCVWSADAARVFVSACQARGYKCVEMPDLVTPRDEMVATIEAASYSAWVQIGRNGTASVSITN